MKIWCICCHLPSLRISMGQSLLSAVDLLLFGLSFFCYMAAILLLSVQTFEMLGNLVNLVTLRLESGGEWPDAGLASTLQKMKKFVTLLFSSYV